MKIIAEGELSVAVLERNNDTLRVAYSMPNSEIVLLLGEQLLLESAKKISTDFAKPVIADLDLQGQIHSLLFPQYYDELSRNSFRTIIASFQVSLPKDEQDPEAWEVWEDVPAGRCRAVYQSNFSIHPERIALIKSREEIEPPKFHRTTGEETMGMTFVPAGSLQIIFDSQLGLVRSIEGTESTEVLVSDTTLSTSESSIRYEFLRNEHASAEQLSLLIKQSSKIAESVNPETLTNHFAPADIKKLQIKQLGDSTFESLVADLVREESNQQEKKDQTPLYLKIKAFMVVHPESSERWGDLARRATPGSLTLKLIPTALVSVGDDESQLALLNLLKARSPEPLVAQSLLVTISQIKAPTLALEEAVRDLARNSPIPGLAPLAQLCLGSIARNLSKTAAPRAAQIVAWAVEEIQKADSEEKTQHWLMILGNAGLSESVPIISSYLNDKSNILRRTAISALRFIHSKETEEILLHTLTTDSDSDIREEVVVTFRFRFLTSQAYETLQNVLQTDESTKVRLATLNLLWPMRERFPQLMRVVEKAAEAQTNSEVRDAALRLLSGELSSR
ncbi:HEAT repeat domain-containing protein [Telmatocola sphagniphila]|uniref:HEAT repeat domain-containing protein n=1 Tax=Telmatocola sphagniphila TaxID=1123043 RepID=A0A8E6B9Y6_9BACT|nr:HEAT repeat domain-containing protein [Telmatocola sphagniphila]QVL34097.1 HEAT repeat domain-containing protein [Telmatocola sphagniphila]